MLYSIVKACLGAASEEMAHSNTALPSAFSLYMSGSRVTKYTSSAHKRPKTNLTSTLQSDTQSY